ncbi:Hypothetical predicted protein [Olea europaea subsp. europaea]|uniref:Pollen Ole e 1 allergen and extensin family protein n=1 Tax=Olea europaea subsp. europaea TaxID=158383 RepID=A0A8S0RRU5_OLEEU|nr:Hypothetical predicted protein [Olea europaea subsp. europaea]
MSHFRGCNTLVNMIFFIFLLLLCPGTLSTAAGQEKSIIELPTVNEDLVNWAGYGEEQLSRVLITGELLCHGDRNHKDSVHPLPVSDASIAVFCGTSSSETRKSYAMGKTNGYGEFHIDLPSHLHAIPNLEKICLVKVLHLPKTCSCRHAFTGKHKGIELTSIGEGIRTYTAHKIHLLSKPAKRYMNRRAKTRNNM